MKTIIRSACLFALMFGGNHAWAQDQTIYLSFGCVNDAMEASTYEIWLYNDNADTDWGAAQAFAASRDLRGATGHLASFSDATEESCVLAQAASLDELGVNKQLWIGLRQDPAGKEPAEGWQWVQADGTFDDIGPYINWANNEPNNAGGSENHGTIGRYGYAPGDGWNDENINRPSLRGFVVEYDVAALGEVVIECDPDCTIEIPSQNPENNTITLPIEAQGGVADVGVFLIEESCAAISGQPIYGTRTVNFGVGAEADSIDLPNYLCADRWILISSALDEGVTSGIVEAEFEPDDFGLVSQGCASDLALPLADPLATDLVTYLPESKQWGVPPDGGAFPRAAPWMQDRTWDCGSSRGRMRGNRYFGVGLNFFFMGTDFGTSPEFIQGELLSLTLNKLDWLLESIEDARSRKVIKRRDYLKMKFLVQVAIYKANQGKYGKAIWTLRLLERIQDRVRYRTNNAGGLNFDGENKARISNAIYLLKYYVKPYDP